MSVVLQDGARVVQGVVTLPIAKQASRDGAPCGAPLGYIAGPENALLSAVLLELLSAAADGRASDVSSPLVLIGPAGCGKSHLAHGLARCLAEQFGSEHVALLTASDYRREQLDAIRADQAATWQKRIRSLDALVLEDIDHLSVRESVQQELAWTLDELIDRGALVVITSSRPPAHLVGWLPELVSRLLSGLSIDIAPPGELARRGYIEQLLARHDWSTTPALIDAIAQQCASAAPQVARRIAELNQRFPGGDGATPGNTRAFLNRQVAARAPSLGDILGIVSRYYSVPQRQITGGSRQQEVVQARAMAITLARRLTSLSYEQIGTRLGGRDHTTILHHHRKIESRLSTDAATRSALADLQRLIEAK